MIAQSASPTRHPFFAGHMDWADDSQLLPDAAKFPNFVKCCRHFVAAFEQRSCFPLDSIRNEDGQYSLNTYEVVYPGVHSDVRGGYPQSDQEIVSLFRPHGKEAVRAFSHAA